MNQRFGAAMRPEFCLREGIDFLNHGSFGATPRRVLAAQDAWRARMEEQPVDFLYRQLMPLLRQAAAQVAHFVGARPEDTALADNATTAMNGVARSLDLGPGDQVLITSHAHPGSRNPLEYVTARAGAELVVVPLSYPVHDEYEIIEPVLAALTERTRLAVFDHIGSATALRMPIAGERGLVASCHERGVPVLIDGAHAPGHIDLDVPAIDADYYVGNCHKWLFAPRGCAFLWAREALHDDLYPAVIADRYTRGADVAWADRFHWLGTRDPSAWLSVTAAIDWMRELDPRAVREHNASLCERAADLLLTRLRGKGPRWDHAWDSGPPMPRDMRCAMVTLPLGFDWPATGEAARSINHALWQEHRIEVPIVPLGDRLWVRISAQVYNTLDQYERLADALIALAGAG